MNKSENITLSIEENLCTVGRVICSSAVKPIHENIIVDKIKVREFKSPILISELIGRKRAVAKGRYT